MHPPLTGTYLLVCAAMLSLLACNVGESVAFTEKDSGNDDRDAQDVPNETAPSASGLVVITAEDSALPIALEASDPDGNPLTFAIDSTPQHGTIVDLDDVAGTLTYVPNPNYAGSDGFTFHVTDGRFDSNSAEVTIEVTPVNDAPRAESATVTTPEDTPLLIELSGEDADGPPPGFTIIEAPQGELDTRNIVSGMVTYTPPRDFVGNDSFVFQATDNQLTSDDATLTIVVTEVNDAPVISPVTPVTTDEDVSVEIPIVVTDADGDEVTIAVSIAPMFGDVDVTDTSISYIPATEFAGMDTFVIIADDGLAMSQPVAIDVTVNAVDDVPVAVDRNLMGAVEDTPAFFSQVLSGSDADGMVVRYEIASQANNGTVTIANVTDIDYTPDADFFGTDSFTYVAIDESEQRSAEATVTIEVAGVNDAPVATTDVMFTLDEDATTTESFDVIDVDGDDVDIVFVTESTLGSVAQLAGDEIEFTGFADIFGVETLTWYATDGDENSAVHSVTIDVRSVNDLPLAPDLVVTTDSGVTTDIVLPVSDVEDPVSALTVLLGLTLPMNGSVDIDNTSKTATYTSDGDFVGVDVFTYFVVDSEGATSVGTITVNVVPPNPAPVLARTAFGTGPQDQAINITAMSSDDTGVTAGFLLSGPRNGQISYTVPSTVGYMPDAGFIGYDEVRAVVSDGSKLSNVGTVGFLVHPIPTGRTTGAPVVEITGCGTYEQDSTTFHFADDLVANTSPCLTFTGSNINIETSGRGLFGTSGEVGVVIDGGTNVYISEIYLDFLSDALVIDSATNVRVHAAFLNNSNTRSLVAIDTSNLFVSDSEIHGTTAVSLDTSSRVTVSGSFGAPTDEAFSMIDATGVLLVLNNFTTAAVAVHVDGTSEAIVAGNDWVGHGTVLSLESIDANVLMAMNIFDDIGETVRFTSNADTSAVTLRLNRYLDGAPNPHISIAGLASGNIVTVHGDPLPQLPTPVGNQQQGLSEVDVRVVDAGGSVEGAMASIVGPSILGSGSTNSSGFWSSGALVTWSNFTDRSLVDLSVDGDPLSPRAVDTDEEEVSVVNLDP